LEKLYNLLAWSIQVLHKHKEEGGVSKLHIREGAKNRLRGGALFYQTKKNLPNYTEFLPNYTGFLPNHTGFLPN